MIEKNKTIQAEIVKLVRLLQDMQVDVITLWFQAKVYGKCRSWWKCKEHGRSALWWS